MAVNLNSPFNKSEFQNLETGVLQKPGILSGLKLPDGNILVNLHSNTSEEMMVTFARLFNAERVLVKGKWVFVPDKEEDEQDAEG